MYVILSTIDTNKLLAPYVFNSEMDAEEYARKEFIADSWKTFRVDFYSFDGWCD